jgi:chromosome segregation ATPase
MMQGRLVLSLSIKCYNKRNSCRKGRSLMEETLQQILLELKGLKEGQSSLETKFGKMEESQSDLGNRFGKMEESQSDLGNRFGKMEESQSNLEKGFAELKSSQNNLETAFDEMKQSQIRMEKGQERFQKNLVESLGTYTDKIIDHIDNRTEALNKRVYKVEADIEKLSRQ